MTVMTHDTTSNHRKSRRRVVQNIYARENQHGTCVVQNILEIQIVFRRSMPSGSMLIFPSVFEDPERSRCLVTATWIRREALINDVR